MVLKRKITMVYPNYSGNYNEFRHIIADNEIRLAYLQFVNVPNFPLINKYPEILSIKYISSSCLQPIWAGQSKWRHITVLYLYLLSCIYKKQPVCYVLFLCILGSPGKHCDSISKERRICKESLNRERVRCTDPSLRLAASSMVTTRRFRLW